MFENVQCPIVAINADAIISLIVITFVIVSGIVNFLKEKTRNAERAANRQRANRGDGGGAKPRKSIQDEIDQFLQEVGGKPKQKPQREQAIEIVEVDDPVRERRRRPQQQRRQRKPQSRQQGQQSKRPTQPPRPQPTKRQKPGARLHDREAPGSRDLGGGVREHVQEHMKDHIVAEAQENLSHDVNQSVQEHLGTFRAAAPLPIDDNLSGLDANSIVAMLQSPAGVRQAILMNEILTRPKGLR